MKKIPWNRYKNIINEFHDEAFQQEVIWKQNTTRKDTFYGEDRPSNTFNDVVLKGLIQYNDFRTWPITKFDVSGSLDKQSEVLLLNLQYLRSNNLLDAENRFNYNSSLDRFYHNGIMYQDAGSTNTAQASDEPLLLYIILKRVNG